MILSSLLPADPIKIIMRNKKALIGQCHRDREEIPQTRLPRLCRRWGGYDAAWGERPPGEAVAQVTAGLPGGILRSSRCAKLGCDKRKGEEGRLVK